MVKNIFLSLLVIFLAGCTTFAKGPTFSEQNPSMQSGTQLIVYRNYKFGDKCMQFNIFVDNQNVGTLKCSGYLERTITPGTHYIKASQVPEFLSGKPMEFETVIRATSGKKSFVKLSANFFGGSTGAANALGFVAMNVVGVGVFHTQYKLMPINPNEAVTEINDLHQSA